MRCCSGSLWISVKQRWTTIWKLGHCPRARDAPGTFFIGFFEFEQGHRGPMIPYCPG
ncbi:unnamed protein product, partial [Staurois parvus]